MQDLDFIARFYKDYDIDLQQIDSYEWEKLGYVMNMEGRIEVLNLHGTEIKKIPDYIDQLSELKVLHLVACNISSIIEIKNSKKLQILALQGNEITDISTLSKLPELKEVNLSQNPIKNLTPLAQLRNLTKLSVNSKYLQSLLPINYMQNLVEVGIRLIQHDNIDFILKCKKLKKITFLGDSYREQKGIPKQLYNYLEKSNITELNVIGLESINFKRISNLKKLVSLQVAVCRLVNIEDISNMTQLRKLDLSHNEIKDITSLLHLTNLTKLILRSNLINNINSLAKLPNLTELDISRNHINNIESLAELIQIKELNLSRNDISDISCLAKLTKLNKLNLAETKITNLAPLIDSHMKFTHTLLYNKFNIYNDTSEGEIRITGCDNIINPPIEIVQQGDEAIRRYFKKIDTEGIEYIYEAKLILVGEGSSGKTSLQRRLIDADNELPKSDTRTRGIDVVDFVFERENNAHKIAHIWDFGGQDVYYPVHRFFITENSVFVLLASTRQTNHNFDYWIPTIFQFGGKSPIIIGQTCHDGNPAPWNDVDTYVGNANFNIVKTLDRPFYQINLPKQNEGLNVIKECITSQIKNLHHFGKGVPKSWLTIRNMLSEHINSDSCIPFQSFVDLCRDAVPKSFQELQDIEDCCQFFHDIGVVLWYAKSEGLSDWVILNPQWAMNAVYEIIDDVDIQERNGHILTKDFKRLWCDRSYENKHSVLKKMLETFKIAFQKKHDIDEYIIPARLSSIPKENKWAMEEQCLRLEYKFEFMPRGIVNQISAELSRYILEDEVWNNAVNLAYENEYTKCQIIEDSYNRKVSINSKGIDARGMNILVMNAMKDIIDSYKGVKENIIVKCPCNVCQTLEAPTEFPYNRLIEWLNKQGRKEVFCNESGITLQIEELLYNTGLQQTVSKPTKQKEPQTIQLFLASSEELKTDREQLEIFINRENKELNKVGIFLSLQVWEDFIDKMSKTRLQDEYNKEVKKSDVFISLFWTKTGKYTHEEFNEAFNHFQKTGKPFIYTYFKNAAIKPANIREKDVNSLLAFKDELKNLGHFPTKYENIDDLKYQLKMQLQKIIPELLKK